MHPSSNSVHVEATEVAVVIVNYRTADLALSCLEAVASERLALPRLRAIVVDGHSEDGSAECLSEKLEGAQLASWASLLALPINGGFGWANNQAILTLLNSERPPEFIHLLNPDTVVQPGAILSLVRGLQSNLAAAAVGSQLLDPDGLASGSAFSFPTLRGEFARGARTGFIDRILAISPIPEALPKAQEVDWVTGASVMLRSSALRQVGLFDDGFFLYHEEVELMWRLRKAGWSIVHEPASRVIHVGGASTGHRERRRDLEVIPRRPAYWYQSRRRYFARIGGPAAATLALALWFGGHLIFRMSRFVRRGLAKRLLAHEVMDHFKYGRPRPSDSISGVTSASRTPGALPAWMEH